MFAVKRGRCQFRQGQFVEHVPDGLRNRKRLYLRPQRTQDRKNRRQVFEGRLPRPILQESPLHDRLDLDVGTAAVWRSQHPDCGQFIPGVGQETPHVAAIDHLLTFVKVFFPFGKARQVVSPKGFEADSQMGERSKQDRHVARLDRYRATTQEQVFLVQDFLPQPARQGVRLRAAGRVRIRVFLRKSDDAELHPFVEQGKRVRRHGNQRFVKRLHPFDGSGRKHIAATAIYRIQHLVMGPKVSLEGILLPLGRQDMLPDDGIVGLDVRPSKRINGLLGIAHDKQFTRFRMHVMPFPGFGAPGLGQKQDQLVLDRIGVLKFIHDDRLILLFQFGPHVRMVSKQGPGPRE